MKSCREFGIWTRVFFFAFGMRRESGFILPHGERENEKEKEEERESVCLETLLHRFPLRVAPAALRCAATLLRKFPTNHVALRHESPRRYDPFLFSSSLSPRIGLLTVARRSLSRAELIPPRGPLRNPYIADEIKVFRMDAPSSARRHATTLDASFHCRGLFKFFSRGRVASATTGRACETLGAQKVRTAAKREAEPRPPLDLWPQGQENFHGDSP